MSETLSLVKSGTTRIRQLMAPECLQIAASFPTRMTIAAMCRTNHFLTSAAQVDLIRQTIQKNPKCRALIFGLGNDSEFYRRMNPGGRTVFLEDDSAWIEMMTKKYPQLEAYRVRYTTRVDQWEDYAEHPEFFTTALPAELDGLRWDVIFVDSPRGSEASHPGRMESIRLASTLIARPGHVFVHDCERTLEALFTTKYLGAENLREEIDNLRHYGFASGQGA